MKSLLLFIFIILGFAVWSCNNNELPPVAVDNAYVNPYAGSFLGIYKQEVNGVDSNGVFKTSDSSTYSIDILDAGNKEITIEKGPFIFDHVPVDSNGYFSTDSPYVASDSLDYVMHGHYSNDSVYLEYKTLNGSYNYPQWFTIVSLSFRGKKIL